MSRLKRRPTFIYQRVWDDWDDWLPAYPQTSWYAPGPFPNDWAWVTDQVATGGMPLSTDEVTNLVRAGITHIVNVSDEWVRHASEVLEPDERIRYLFNPAPDNGAWKPKEWFQRTLDFAVPAVENGDRVYIHCLCGSNRGPSNAYAVLRALGYPAAEAEALIREARPNARLRYLQDAEQAVTT